MSDSVLDRIRKNRQRQEVTPRSDTLITASQPEERETEPLQAFEDVPEEKPVEQKTAPDMPPPSDPLQELRAELAQIPETNRHSAIVLEKELDQNLTRYCKDNRITVEVFLEAAWMYANAHPDAMEDILTEAKRRYGDRKKAGKLRRLITMLEKQS